MGRTRIPKYRHFRPKDLAVVRLNGRDYYLGKYGSVQSVERYHRLIAEYLASVSAASLPLRGDPPCEPDLSVNELILRYVQFADGYYVAICGSPRCPCPASGSRLRCVRTGDNYGEPGKSFQFGPRRVSS